MKTVVITGGTRGIGRAIAEKFASSDFNVCVIYNNSQQNAKDLEHEFCNVKTFKCDISKSSEVLKTAEIILNYYKNIDIVINNAGISSYGLINDTTETDFDKIFNINVKGTYNVTNAFIKNMISNHSGNIINISSMWGQVGASFEVLYSASKGAINAFTKALAKEVGLSGIRVNCICPGVIKTDMISDLDEQTIDYLTEETPLNRLGTPQDVANMAYFLASEQSSFITGQIIGVNGGFVI